MKFRELYFGKGQLVWKDMNFDTRKEMDMESLQMSRVFTLIEPGPVVLVTTNDGRKDNVMTISWTMVLDSRVCHYHRAMELFIHRTSRIEGVCNFNPNGGPN
jgi:hypothetical protein